MLAREASEGWSETDAARQLDDRALKTAAAIVEVLAAGGKQAAAGIQADIFAKE